jgi:Skp family chaperone for outer membrane proteins
MRPYQATLLTLLASSLTAAAAPRIALVRVREIYAGLASSVVLQEQVKKERDGIMKNERAEQLRKALGELQAIQAQLSDKTKRPDAELSTRLARSYEIKRQEAQTLQQDFESNKSEQEKLINRKMVTAMRESLDKITSAAQKIAKDKGYETVLDSSGDSNTGVPFVLYAKDANDYTAEVIAALKDSEAALAKSAETAKPSDAAAQKPGGKPTR